ncbi:MAG: tRNA 4-thiouridine(8) synthase ThiI [Lachnospiraceae bacterium]|nr:tRNA 4-thiouridine(8) synthase ThiI [Lachnospiraceae bacterium]
MKHETFLIKYAEIGVKGKNRYKFEDALVAQIRRVMHRTEGSFEVEKRDGRIYVHCAGDYDEQDVIEALGRVFGIWSIHPVMRLPKMPPEQLMQEAVRFVRETYPDRDGLTFKVRAKRADKGYPLHSDDINRDVGAAILDAFPEMHVNVHDPDVLIQVEIRDRINIFSESLPGPGGMPVGTAGRAMLLLSGGIDSPVAGYMIARRGVEIDAVYFHAPPYTSDRAKEKVLDLAKRVSRYAGPIRVHVVNFTDVQLKIYETCPHDELTIIMRRYMMRIAEHFAKADDCLGTVTGESIGQVASQTMYSLNCTNEVATLPVYRPLIAFDKEDIVRIAKKIDTYETSILPFEDCCTIFVAEHPVTKPKPAQIAASEARLAGKIEPLVEEAIRTAEEVWIGGKRSGANAQ